VAAGEELQLPLHVLSVLEQHLNPDCLDSSGPSCSFLVQRTDESKGQQRPDHAEPG